MTKTFRFSIVAATMMFVVVSKVMAQYGVGMSRSDMTVMRALIQNQQMLQQYSNQLQQMTQRSERARAEQIGWSTKFYSENGRYPTQLEKDEWMRQNYPDIYQVDMQARAAQTVREGSVKSSKVGSGFTFSGSSSKACSMCVGKGGVTGKCYFCVNGYVTDNSYGTLRKRRCSSCTTTPGVCEYCHGTGKQ